MPPHLRARAAAAFPAVAGLAPRLAARFDNETQLVQAPAGAMVFEPGSPCQSFPIVMAGRIRVARLAENGREIVLYRVIPGEPCVVTTQCLTGRSDYPARGVVEADLTAVAVPFALFDALMAGHPPFRQSLMAHFADRVVSLMTLVEEVAFSRLDSRLAALLVRRGPDIRATHQALAEELGSVREAVSRLLKQFEARGWVVLGRERVSIIRPDALAEVSRPNDGRQAV